MKDALDINSRVRILLSEIELKPIRSQGPGGQNVNKVSSAIHLRFDIHGSSLSDYHKSRLLSLRDKRITDAGVLILKAQSSRTQAQNKQDALERLTVILQNAFKVQTARKATKPTWGSVKRKRVTKSHRSAIKSSRKKIDGSRD